MCNCRFCCKDENFAYFVVNDNGKGSRILIRSGGEMPLIILSENLIQNRWHTLGAYMPKFRPECGRKLEVLQ
jgi:hypothetical protein